LGYVSLAECIGVSSNTYLIGPKATELAK